MKVAEVFGPTVQGEGPNLGRRSLFIRLGRCNLSCQWCDTPYTWDWRGKNGIAYSPRKELTERTVPELLAWADRIDPWCEHVVVTGGEPLVQAKSLAELTNTLQGTGYSVEVETNGTVYPPTNMRCGWNVSPKLAHSGDPESKRLHYQALARFAELGAAFKFVVQSAEDLREVEQVVRRAGVHATQVWIMPEGRSSGMVRLVASEVADAVLARGWNLTTRLHLLLWGDVRGR